MCLHGELDESVVNSPASPLHMCHGSFSVRLAIGVTVHMPVGVIIHGVDLFHNDILS